MTQQENTPDGGMYHSAEQLGSISVPRGSLVGNGSKKFSKLTLFLRNGSELLL
jgi:hypothetical protein